MVMEYGNVNLILLIYVVHGCVLKIFDEDIGVMSWMPQVFC